MKLLMFLTLTLSAVFANAMTIKECSLKAMSASAYLYTKDVKLSDGRTTGREADANFERALRLTGAVAGNDELGVVRYLSSSERNLVETDNGEINSCEGNTKVFLNRKCTTGADRSKSVCETFCSREWQGWECR